MQNCGIFQAIGLAAAEEHILEEHQSEPLEGIDFETVGTGESPRVVDGTNAAAWFFPEYASLTTQFSSTVSLGCGGTIISATYVLTSAGCVVSNGVTATPANVVVHLGVRNYNLPRAKAIGVTVTPHPLYNAATHLADIALVKINKSIPSAITPFIFYANLDTVANINNQYVGSLMDVCGFGAVNNAGGLPVLLQWTSLNGVAASVCGNVPGTICTQWTTKDNNICAGDQGGPIFAFNAASTQIQVGITSFIVNPNSAAPCQDGHISAYTSIATYATWIATTAV